MDLTNSIISPKTKAKLDTDRYGLNRAITNAEECIERNVEGTFDGDYWRAVLRQLVQIAITRKD